MRSVKLLTDALGPDRAAADKWYVSNGVTAVGPVNTDLLARGIEAGKVPLESFVRHEAWKVWRPLTEIAVVTGADGVVTALGSLGEPSIARSDAITPEEQANFEALSRPGVPLAQATDPRPSWPPASAPGGPASDPTEVGLRSQSFQDFEDDLTPPGLPPFRQATGPVSEPDFAIFTPPPPPPDPSDDADRVIDEGPLSAPPLLVPIPVPAFSVPAMSVPSDSDARPTTRRRDLPPQAPGFEAARSLSEALLLLLSAAAERASAEAALVHHVLDDEAVVVCAHGPRMHEVLGRRTPLTDPAVMAAASGLSIVTEPSPGPAGLAILARLTELGAPLGFALMLPIRPGGRLFGMLEMGRPTPFSPGEVAEAGNLTTEVARLIDAAGWG
jgi:hypothetical protein